MRVLAVAWGGVLPTFAPRGPYAAAWLAALAISGAPLSSWGQSDPPPQTERPTWSFQWENDLFAKSRNDRYYTNGLRLLYSRPAWALSEKREDGLAEKTGSYTAEWLCTWRSCNRSRANVVVDTHGGQNIYTPQNLRRATANPYDRPYAGWAYFGQRTRLFDVPDEDDEATRMQTLDVSVGVVGPSAGAGAIQSEWHRLVSAIHPRGWSTQLRDEPGLLITYASNHRVELGPLFDTLPYWRVMVGNVQTSAAVGTQFRLGPHLAGFGHFDPIPATVVTPMSATNLRQDKKQRRAKDSPLYAFVALEGRAVARNIFIDGNTWRDYPSVNFISRRPLVGDFTLGFSAKVFGTARLTYGHTWRTKEFRNDRPPPPGTARSQTQRYGVIQFQWETTWR